MSASTNSERSSESESPAEPVAPADLGPCRIGIDLGTTHSAVAICEDGLPRIVPNSLGSPLTPSVVSILGGDVLVGAPARDRLLTHPQMTAANFKRDMGVDTRRHLGDHHLSPVELSACVLMTLVADASRALKRPIGEAVITVPAYFDESQRRATHEAARLARLPVERLINEPTAAAIAYGLHQLDQEQRAVVLDLGGGTFDVTVLEIMEGVIEIQSTAGDTQLGGEDFTACIAELLAGRFRELTGEEPKHAHPSLPRLRKAAEEAKRRLSHDTELVVEVQALGKLNRDEVDLILPLGRQQVEKLWRPLLERLRQPVLRALHDAELSIAQVDRVLLVGGATRMPCFVDLVRELFRLEPLCDLPVDEIVALGASVQAALKSGDTALDDVVVTDISPFTLGVETVSDVGGQQIGDIFTPVLERGTVLPASRVKRFYTASHQQSSILVRIFQGEHSQCAYNLPVGHLEIAGLPARPAGEEGVDIRFTYDLNGLVEVEATVVSTGEKKSTVIQKAAGELAGEELERAVRAMASLKIHPAEQLPNQAALSAAEARFVELKGTARSLLGEEIQAFRAALETQDVATIDMYRERLLRSLERFRSR